MGKAWPPRSHTPRPRAAKVWALALDCHLLVAGGALSADGEGGHICVMLFDVARLAAGAGAATALRTLRAQSHARQWGVRSVATHGGTAVVAGGDDGVVHVWTLAEKGKAEGEMESGRVSEV